MLSDVVGEQIAHWRRKRGLNREALAERCKELGLPKMSPSIITNIESGRRVKGSPRRTVTVDELMVFARALNVAPMLLLVPYPDKTSIELLPGELVQSTSAIEWVGGEAFAGGELSGMPRSASELDEWMDAIKPLAFLRLHRQALNTYINRLSQLRQAQDAEVRQSYEDGADAAALADLARRRVEVRQDALLKSERYIADLRATMKAEGCPPPILPAAFKHLEEVEGTRTRVTWAFDRPDEGDDVGRTRFGLVPPAVNDGGIG